MTILSGMRLSMANFCDVAMNRQLLEKRVFFSNYELVYRII
jgi:hypothetical protein